MGGTVNIMDSRAKFRVGMGFFTRTLVGPLPKSRPLALSEILTAAHRISIVGLCAFIQERAWIRAAPHPKLCVDAARSRCPRVWSNSGVSWSLPRIRISEQQQPVREAARASSCCSIVPAHGPALSVLSCDDT